MALGIDVRPPEADFGNSGGRSNDDGSPAFSCAHVHAHERVMTVARRSIGRVKFFDGARIGHRRCAALADILPAHSEVQRATPLLRSALNSIPHLVRAVELTEQGKRLDPAKSIRACAPQMADKSLGSRPKPQTGRVQMTRRPYRIQAPRQG